MVRATTISNTPKCTNPCEIPVLVIEEEICIGEFKRVTVAEILAGEESEKKNQRKRQKLSSSLKFSAWVLTFSFLHTQFATYTVRTHGGWVDKAALPKMPQYHSAFCRRNTFLTKCTNNCRRYASYSFVDEVFLYFCSLRCHALALPPYTQSCWLNGHLSFWRRSTPSLKSCSASFQLFFFSSSLLFCRGESICVLLGILDLWWWLDFALRMCLLAWLEQFAHSGRRTFLPTRQKR